MCWSTSELRYLRQHRAEGSRAIAAALGRSQKAVKNMAERHKIKLGRRGPGELCPRCATYRLALGTEAARQGLCVVCHEREKAALRRQAAAEDCARREYEQAKKAAQRRRA